MARYLAVLIHRLLAHGQAWIDQGLRSLNEKRLNRELANLHSRARAQGFVLVPIAENPLHYLQPTVDSGNAGELTLEVSFYFNRQRRFISSRDHAANKQTNPQPKIAVARTSSFWRGGQL